MLCYIPYSIQYFLLGSNGGHSTKVVKINKNLNLSRVADPIFGYTKNTILTDKIIASYSDYFLFTSLELLYEE